MVMVPGQVQVQGPSRRSVRWLWRSMQQLKWRQVVMEERQEELQQLFVGTVAGVYWDSAPRLPRRWAQRLWSQQPEEQVDDQEKDEEVGNQLLAALAAAVARAGCDWKCRRDG